MARIAGSTRARLLEDRLDVRLGQHQQRVLGDAEAVGAHLHLLGRFLAGDVERAALARQLRQRLEDERRLADARIAADQDHRPRHDAAAQHAVELADAARAAPLGRRGQAGDRLRRATLAGGASAALRRGREAFLDQRVPLAALGAATQPARRLRPAALADEDGALLGHCGRAIANRRAGQPCGASMPRCTEGRASPALRPRCDGAAAPRLAQARQATPVVTVVAAGTGRSQLATRIRASSTTRAVHEQSGAPLSILLDLAQPHREETHHATLASLHGFR